MQIQIPHDVELARALRGSPDVRVIRGIEGPVRVEGDAAGLSRALTTFWLRRARPWGHRIDATRRPPSTEEAPDVPSGCIVVIDPAGHEHGPYCDPGTMGDWLTDRFLALGEEEGMAGGLVGV
ncbi:hypothetical protein [Terrabacter sp. NPDC000476]|uniref:hypothetical protein n=1 Tax=Terrabacter sp. NPDC000476 TaxID=3154258 RepID=UPI003330623B